LENTHHQLPGKLFEYMVSERPILALSPQGSDFAAIIKDTNTGVFVTYKEEELLKNTILKFYSLYLKGKLQSHAVGLQQYSRKKLTEKLANLLK
jgi:hypothetical protein